MTPSHLMALCAIIGATLCIAARLLVLLRKGARRAQAGLPIAKGSESANSRVPALTSVEWREIGSPVRTSWLASQRLRQFLIRWTSRIRQTSIWAPKHVIMQTQTVMDPLDGTAFEAGEAVV